MATEATLQAKIVKYMRAQGWLVYKFASPSTTGVPDLLLLRSGETMFIEVKSPNGTGRLSRMQERQILHIQKHGHVVLVVDSMDELHAQIGGH